MEDFQDDIDKCLATLEQGGLILYPTDTVWGIGCDATNTEAVSKIYALKQREDNKKMIVLMASEREIMQYVTQNIKCLSSCEYPHSSMETGFLPNI